MFLSAADGLREVDLRDHRGEVNSHAPDLEIRSWRQGKQLDFLSTVSVCIFSLYISGLLTLPRLTVFLTMMGDGSMGVEEVSDITPFDFAQLNSLR